ncbi:MAG: tetratricopeptide repeat protein [Spirochaetales bacterium]|nr:tetratricopeptide repeat protein [Spirochaetales bacterium]
MKYILNVLTLCLPLFLVFPIIRQNRILEEHRRLNDELLKETAQIVSRVELLEEARFIAGDFFESLRINSSLEADPSPDGFWIESIERLENRMEKEVLRLDQRLSSLGETCHAEPESSGLFEEKYEEALAFFAEGSYREALDIFSVAIRDNPGNEEVLYYYLASLYYSDPLKRSHYALLKEKLSRFEGNYSRSAHMVLAEVYLAEEDIISAKEVYKEILGLDRDNPRALRSLGLIEYQTGNIAGAIDSFKPYLEYHPDDFEIIFSYGLALKQLGNYREALEQFYLSLQADAPFGNVDVMIRETLELIKEGCYE